jgi:predicted MFS family arabinose efflux permease
MKWIVVVVLSVLYSIYTGLDRYGIVSAIVAGFIVGLAGLLWVVLRLARLFREKAPGAAKISGNTVFCLGVAIGVWMSGTTASAVYQGASAHLAGTLLLIAAAYFALGFGIRYLLRPNQV